MIVDPETFKVPMAMIVYEDGSRKPVPIPPKYITNRDDSSDFTIDCQLDEIITVPKKRIEIYITQCNKVKELE